MATKKVKVFKAINPEGEVKLETSKKSELLAFSEENAIASPGWVNLSIRKGIPVLMGLGKDQDPNDPEFKPRTTKKYSGNYWKFVKEETEVEVEEKPEAAE